MSPVMHDSFVSDAMAVAWPIGPGPQAPNRDDARVHSVHPIPKGQRSAACQTQGWVDPGAWSQDEAGQQTPSICPPDEYGR